MASIVFHPEQSIAGLHPSLLAALGPAVSSGTRDITDQIDALRRRPSPALLQPEVGSASQGKSAGEPLFDALAAAKILTSQVAMHLDEGWRDKLFRQLDSLHDPAEWEQD